MGIISFSLYNLRGPPPPRQNNEEIESIRAEASIHRFGGGGAFTKCALTGEIAAAVAAKAFVVDDGPRPRKCGLFESTIA